MSKNPGQEMLEVEENARIELDILSKLKWGRRGFLWRVVIIAAVRIGVAVTIIAYFIATRSPVTESAGQILIPLGLIYVVAEIIELLIYRDRSIRFVIAADWNILKSARRLQDLRKTADPTKQG